MAQTTALVDALKDVLRARGATYTRLAKGIGPSEARVKRIFAARSFTRERLDQVWSLLGIEIIDLAKMVAQESGSPERLSEEQERELLSDAKLLLVAVHAMNHLSFDEIVQHSAVVCGWRPAAAGGIASPHERADSQSFERCVRVLPTKHHGPRACRVGP